MKRDLEKLGSAFNTPYLQKISAVAVEASQLLMADFHKNWVNGHLLVDVAGVHYFIDLCRLDVRKYD